MSRETRTFYDSLNRVSRTVVNYIDGQYSAGAPDQELITAYAYDAVGNQRLITDTLDRVTAYDYDALHRVITVTANYVAGGPVDQQTNVKTVYAYDPAGNRLSVTDAEGRTTTYGYDRLNRVVTTTNRPGWPNPRGLRRSGQPGQHHRRQHPHHPLRL